MPFSDHDASVYELELQMDNPTDARALEVRMVGEGKRVLELGSAGGIVTEALEARGCQVVAVEIDPVAAERAASHAERVIVGDLEDDETWSQLAGDQFDVVVAGDVLEHLREPVPALRAARDLLRPDGFLVASIPNIAHIDVRLSLLAGRFPYSATGLLDRTHLRFFTLETVEALLDEAGMAIADFERIRLPVFSTELKIDPASVSAELVQDLLRDPEAETYQFVLRAVVRFTDDAREALVRRSATLAAALADQESANRQLRRDLDEARALVDETVAALDEAHATTAEGEAALAAAELDLAEAQAHAGRLEAEIVRLREYVDAFEATKFYRAAAPFRRVYGAIRRPPAGG